jgi:Holliday junction resolvase RusA-like endonuclease
MRLPYDHTDECNATCQHPAEVDNPVLAFVAYGKPITQGSKVRNRFGGVRDANADKLKPWREAVKFAALAHWPSDAEPISGPIRIDVVYTLPKPASAPVRRRTWPIAMRSGDIDKLDRALFDAITDAGVIHDDAQIVDSRSRKVYPEEHPEALRTPGAVIRIWQVTE